MYFSAIGQGVPPLKDVKQGWGGETSYIFEQNASISETVGDTYTQAVRTV